MRRAHNCDQFNHFVFHVINVIAASCDDSGYFWGETGATDKEKQGQMGPFDISVAYVDAYCTFPRQHNDAGLWPFYRVQYHHVSVCNSFQLYFQADNKERCRIQGGRGLSSLHVPDNTSDLGEKKGDACVEVDHLDHPSYGDNGRDSREACHSAREACSNDLA